MYETGNGSYAGPERRLVLIHRVIVPDNEYPREHAILVTDRRSIFIGQKKSRSGFVLRSETRYGTALVTDTQPKTLEDYENMSLGSLVADASNIIVPHSSAISLVMTKGEPEFRLRDLFIWLTMRRQGHKFHVYDFEMNYWDSANQETKIRFYMVPLGVFQAQKTNPYKGSNSTGIRHGCVQDFSEGPPDQNHILIVSFRTGN